MKAVFLVCAFALAVAAKDFDTKNCLLPPEEGMCRGYFEMYYYDYKSRSCKTFIYGGCDGNGNRFGTEEKCMDKCGDVVVFESDSVCDLRPEAGLCDAYMPRYYFDKDLGVCQRFIYGGCGGNNNNFRSLEECNRRCGREESAPPALCLLDKDTGPCRARMPKFYFNKETGKCEEFVYGGCLGNMNRFSSKEECEGICQ